MNNRFKRLRKDELRMTQKEFAAKINLSENFVWMIEKGERVPSDRTILDICREFNVNETWLRTGEGEMFNDMSRADRLSSEFGRLMRISVSDNPSEGEKLKLKLISFLAQLDSDSWEVLAKIAAQWLDENKKCGE